MIRLALAAALIASLALLAYLITVDWRCKPGDPGTTIGNMLIAGCRP